MNENKLDFLGFWWLVRLKMKMRKSLTPKRNGNFENADGEILEQIGEGNSQVDAGPTTSSYGTHASNSDIIRT